MQLKLAEQAGAGPDATSIEQAAAIARAQVERLARLALAFRQEADDARGAKPVEKLTKPKGGKG